MLWVFAALACSSSDSPENESLGDDTATGGGVYAKLDGQSKV